MDMEEYLDIAQTNLAGNEYASDAEYRDDLEHMPHWLADAFYEEERAEAAEAAEYDEPGTVAAYRKSCQFQTRRALKA
jgi:hypothetical protein